MPGLCSKKVKMPAHKPNIFGKKKDNKNMPTTKNKQISWFHLCLDHAHPAMKCIHIFMRVVDTSFPWQ
jgi:hypothetical protein